MSNSRWRLTPRLTCRLHKAIKFSLEKVGKPERELKRDQYDARRENMLLNKNGANGVANWI